MLELRRAIPFLAIPVLAFALAILVSGCGTGASSTAAPSSSPTLAPSIAPSSTLPSPSPTPLADVEKTPKPTDRLDRIARNRAKWAEAGIDSYRITLRYGCFCNLGDGGRVFVHVVDGEVVEAVSDGKPIRRREWRGFPMTVEALFDYAEAARADADEFDFEFDRDLGYPTLIRVDQILNADDDEFQVIVNGLRPAS